MTLQEAIELIKKGRIFTITFIKRERRYGHGGEVRTMNCRMGVEKPKIGEELPYDPIEKGLLMVFDMQKKGYRQIPIDGIQSLVLDGHQYNYNNETKEFTEIT